MSQSDDDEQLAALYRRYGPVIYWRCRQIVRDDATAEDAAQDTFLKVHRHLAKAPAIEEALAWIWRIATNHCLNEVRNRKRRPEPREELTDAAAGEMPVDQALANRQLFDRIISGMGAKHRVVAWMTYVDGLEPSEIGRALGVTRRTVSNRLEEVRLKARKIIARMP